MRRSVYFNYTRPTQEQLNNTETSRIRTVLDRFQANAQFGISRGFRISINPGNNTLIDIGVGEGFTGGFYRSENLRGDYSGERISTITDEVTGGYTYQGLGLTDYSLNTKNYVSLVYHEVESSPLQETFYPFDSHNTIVNESFLTEVLTETQWNALTAAQKEQRILVAIVTAQGAGNALSLANVQQFIQPKSHPTVGSQPSSITGVTLQGVADETLIGSGTLRFEASTNKLYWTAPGDYEGIGVQITSSGTYTIYSGDTSYWIRVETIFAALPAVNTSESITIVSQYGRYLPMACSVDQAHRDMLGSGLVTSTNPHGLTLDDIEGGTFDHADLFHKNGISGDADSDQLECSIDVANDSINIENKGGYNNSFLIDGLTYQTVTGVAAGTEATLAFDITPALDSGDYLIYLDSAGEPQYVKIAEYAPVNAADDQVLFSANIEIWDMKNNASGNGTLSWNNTTKVLTWQAPGDGATGSDVYVTEDTQPDFYKVYSQDTDNWVVVKVSGTLGATDSSTFAIDKHESDHPEESILKLAIVTWNAIGDIHYTLRDIRSFFTADIKIAFEEEHDSDGFHTKPLQHQLVVASDSNAFYASVQGNTAIFGTADLYGVVGSADVYGVAGFASGAAGNAGVYGSASADYGVYGIADNRYAFYGKASATGVYTSVEANIGVYGIAATNTGVYGRATAATGVYGLASNYGVYGRADVNYGVYGTADADYGVYGTADSYGVYGTADSYGVYGNAAAKYGLFGTASNFAVYGRCSKTAGLFTASGVAIAGSANLAGGGTAVRAVGDIALEAIGSIYIDHAPANAHANSEEELPIRFNGATRYIHLYT